MQLDVVQENKNGFPLLIITMVRVAAVKKFWFKGVPNDVPFYLLEEIEFLIYDY